VAIASSTRKPPVRLDRFGGGDVGIAACRIAFLYRGLHINTKRTGGTRSRYMYRCAGDGLRSAIHPSPVESQEVTMAKGQIRSNREKKKPKQDKNKKKGAEAPSPFAGMHSQVKLGTSYSSQYGKKH
jgi:hypothetical protein